MNVPSSPPPRDLFAGKLERDFYLTAARDLVLDIPGGSAFYAAVGYRVWENDRHPGLVSRVGENYPQAWLKTFDEQGLDTRGVKILPQVLDKRVFYVQKEKGGWTEDHPLSHFTRLAKPLPPVLYNYVSPDNGQVRKRELTTTTLRQKDIPAGYQTGTGAHLGPVDYLTHHLLPSIFRQLGFNTLTLEPCPEYMNPTFYPDIPGLITGLTAFLPDEEQLRSLFKGKKADLWEMAEELGSFGCSLIVIKRKDRSQLLFDHSTGKRWEIPAYPVQAVREIGVGPAFCGGFLAGYRRYFDPVQAVLHGSVSASLVAEGMDPYYALETIPGLARARLEALASRVSEV